MKISAGIVLYEPELKRLLENVTAIIRQVDTVIIVDNASSNIKEVKEVLSRFSNILFLENAQNEGIAVALNQILDISMQIGMDWTLTLDQDSVVCENFIDVSRNYFDLENVAIITPNILDRNDFNQELLDTNENRYVDECITSGSLMNLKFYNSVGKFDEKMFIDYVDFEYCYRVIKAGFKIFKNTNAILLHQLGNGEVKHIFSKKFIVANHNCSRYYYMGKNCIYIMRKHNTYRRMLYVIFRESFLLLAYEKRKLKKFEKMCSGMWAGLWMKV